MRTDKTTRATNIIIGNDLIEEVLDFDYLGSLIANNGDGFKEVNRRLGMAMKKLKSIKKLWKGTNEQTKLKFLKALIFPIATYGSETWSISKQVEQKINAFQMKSFRRILRVSWKEKRTNVSILQQLGNVEENLLLNSVVQRKMAYFGHVKRHDSLERTIYEGIIEGRRGRGRPRRRWSQDISDRLNTTVTEAGRRAQDRSAYRKAVADATCRRASATR